MVVGEQCNCEGVLKSFKRDTGTARGVIKPPRHHEARLLLEVTHTLCTWYTQGNVQHTHNNKYSHWHIHMCVCALTQPHTHPLVMVTEWVGLERRTIVPKTSGPTAASVLVLVSLFVPLSLACVPCPMCPGWELNCASWLSKLTDEIWNYQQRK